MEFNPTWRHLIQPEVFFVSDSGPNQGCREKSPRWNRHGVPCLDFEAYVVRGLPSQFATASQVYLPWKWPRWWGKWIWTRQRSWRLHGLLWAFYIATPRSGASACSLTLSLWLDDKVGWPIGALFSPQAVQIMNGLFHMTLGSLLLFHMEVYAPICVTLWYPLWGGLLVSKNNQPLGEDADKSIFFFKSQTYTRLFLKSRLTPKSNSINLKKKKKKEDKTKKNLNLKGGE